MTTFNVYYSGGVVKLYRDTNSNYKILPINDGASPTPTLTITPTQTPTVTPTPTPSSVGSLLTIARNNGTSTFTGAGTFASPFTRAAGIYLETVDGLSRYSWTASSTATVTVKFDFSDDDGSDDNATIKKNGSIIHYVSSNINNTRTVSVISGDIITISSTQPVDSQYFSNVSVYAQA